jgi:hypothetical protein
VAVGMSLDRIRNTNLHVMRLETPHVIPAIAVAVAVPDMFIVV